MEIQAMSMKKKFAMELINKEVISITSNII